MLGTIKRAAKLKNKTGKTYETLEDVDFSKVNINDPALVQVGERDPQTNQPRNFVLKVRSVSVKAGETTTTTFSAGNYQRFLKLTLSDDDVLEIVRIVDSEGNRWYEVDYLVQDTVFDSALNIGNDSANVPYVLKLRSVPYRFISEYDISTGKTSIVFGSGDAQTFDGDLIPDLGDLSLPAFGKETFTDFALDPQNFLKTRTMGLAPVNTTLTVTYRVGGGIDTNAGTQEINTVAEKVFEVSDSALASSAVRDVANSFSVLNMQPIIGGNDPLDVEEIRQLIPTVFAAQSRLVNVSDFIVRTLSLPAKFGSVFRANAKLNSLNKNSVELIVLALDVDGYVVKASQQLKENLKTYLGRFRMMTDAIEIMNGEVINLGLDFSILTNPDFNKNEVLSNCIDVLKDFFDIRKFQLNQPINFTDIYVLLSEVPGVVSVIDIKFKNNIGVIEGLQYSQTSYNIAKNTINGILYCKENAIFEIKYKNKDIRRNS
jgi:hypothetical protein